MIGQFTELTKQPTRCKEKPFHGASGPGVCAVHCTRLIGFPMRLFSSLISLQNGRTWDTVILLRGQRIFVAVRAPPYRILPSVQETKNLLPLQVEHVYTTQMQLGAFVAQSLVALCPLVASRWGRGEYKLRLLDRFTWENPGSAIDMTWTPSTLPCTWVARGMWYAYCAYEA